MTDAPEKIWVEEKFWPFVEKSDPSKCWKWLAEAGLPLEGKGDE